MKLCLKILAIAVIAITTYSIIGCAAPPSYSYQNVSIAITSSCGDCEFSGINLIYNPAYPQPPAAGSVAYMPPSGGPGGVAVFTASVTNAPSTSVSWAIYPQPNLTTVNPPSGTTYPVGESGSGVGYFTATSGATAVYIPPGSSPVYTGAALEQAQALGIPQGDVLIVASVPVDPANPSAVVTANQLVQITGSSNPTPRIYPYTPLTPQGTLPAVTVPRNASFAFYGFVYGALPCNSVTACASAGNVPLYTANNTALWYVCTAGTYSIPAAATPTTGCFLGGNSTLGTVTQSGVYTAPAAIPNPLPAVLVMYVTYPTQSIISNASNYALVGVS